MRLFACLEENMKQNIEGKTALLTGAGSGLGRELAIRLTNLGVYVLLCGRKEESLLETQKLCVKDKTKIHILDVCSEESILSLMKQVKFDYLINNAGICITGPFEKIEAEVFDETYRTNVRGPFLMSKYALPILRQSEVATIINIASVTAHTGYVNQASYVASKHALLGLSKVIAKEYYKENIRVHVLCPGGFLTEMMKTNRPDLISDENMLPEDMVDIVEFWLTHRSNAVIDQINVHRANKEPFL